MDAKAERKRAPAKKARKHEPVHEYFDAASPDNLGSGRARQYLLERLHSISPDILKALAETCFRPELLNSGVVGVDLLWDHVRRAGQVDVFETFKPLLAAITVWAKDEPRHRWNLCDNDGSPLDWIAKAAVQMLEDWQRLGRLPKKLSWQLIDRPRVRSLDSDPAIEMFELERHFDAGRLSDREQRKAKKRYKSLGRKLGLRTMSHVESRYFDWYAKHTFLGLKLEAIKERKDANPSDRVLRGSRVTDLSLLSKGIKIVADLVCFRRNPRRKRTKNIQ